MADMICFTSPPRKRLRHQPQQTQINTHNPTRRLDVVFANYVKKIMPRIVMQCEQRSFFDRIRASYVDQHSPSSFVCLWIYWPFKHEVDYVAMPNLSYNIAESVLTEFDKLHYITE